MQRAVRDAAHRNDPKAIDEATDAYDTIDWLVKNVPNNNGRVGMFGVSYDGWTTAMALTDPHPALQGRVTAGVAGRHVEGRRLPPQRRVPSLRYGFEYAAMMETGKENHQFSFDTYDTYEWYLKLGALSNVNPKFLHGEIPTWNDFVAHPNFDDVLAAAGDRAVAQAGHRADAQRRRLVGSGRLLRAGHDLRSAREGRFEKAQLSRRRSVESRRLECRRGTQARQHRLRQRDVEVLPRQHRGCRSSTSISRTRAT